MTSISLLALIVAISTSVQARDVMPGDVVGRDLSVPGAGWIGHVGVAIERYPDMTAGSVYEVLNADKVVQLNKLSSFKSASKYWGNRYGIFGADGRVERMRLEGNIQKFTCPAYTITTDFEPGIYNGATGQILKCGKFRCDTFVNYLYHVGGYDLPTYNSALTVPVRVFNSLPLGVDNQPVEFNNELETYGVQDLLNVMYNENESNYNRQYAIELLGSRGDKDTLASLLNFYSSDLHADLKTSVLQSMQSLYQKRKKVAGLQEFYLSRMKENISEKDMQFAVRGYTSISSPGDILDNLDLINSSLERTFEHAKNSIKTNMAMSNPKLERVFFKDIADTEEGQFSISHRRLPLLPESVQYLNSIKH
jgi:hypothetical protein